MNWDEIIRPCDRHSNETVILRKYVTKYKNMWKCIVEFLGIFETRGIKIARVNSIIITKSIDFQLFTLILYGVGIRCDVDIFKLTVRAQSIYREVYALTYLFCFTQWFYVSTAIFLCLLEQKMWQ